MGAAVVVPSAVMMFVRRVKILSTVPRIAAFRSNGPASPVITELMMAVIADVVLSIRIVSIQQWNHVIGVMIPVPAIQNHVRERLIHWIIRSVLVDQANSSKIFKTTVLIATRIICFDSMINKINREGELEKSHPISYYFIPSKLCRLKLGDFSLFGSVIL